MSNRFQGTGNLGGPPELKHVDKNGERLAVVDLRIYFDRPIRGEGEDSFEDRGGFWITASIWGQRAERAAELLDKGMRVYASGTLMSDTWNDAETGDERAEMQLRLDYLALDLSRVKAIEMVPKHAPADAA